MKRRGRIGFSQRIPLDRLEYTTNLSKSRMMNADENGKLVAGPHLLRVYSE